QLLRLAHVACIRDRAYHLGVYPHATFVRRDAYRMPSKLPHWRLGVAWISSSLQNAAPTTPHKSSTNHGTQPVSQLDLESKYIMRDIIGGQAWSFPPKELSRILSAKSRKPEALSYRPETIDQMVHYDCVGRLETELRTATSCFHGLMRTYRSEQGSYHELAEFLNAGINSIVDQLPTSLCRPLNFHIREKTINDGIDRAAPLCPDPAGMLENAPLLDLFWSSRGPNDCHMILPVEVEGS
ncbi:hypothetical protein BDP27DRAFT_1502882, partial [Rhodocollybia butyracea]